MVLGSDGSSKQKDLRTESCQTQSARIITMKKFVSFLKNESGATAIEYGLIAALIAVGIIVAASALGDSISGTFESVSSTLDAAG